MKTKKSFDDWFYVLSEELGQYYQYGETFKESFRKYWENGDDPRVIADWYILNNQK